MSEQVTIPWSDIDQAFSVKSVGMTERDVFLFDRLAKGVLESRELHFDYRKLKDDAASRRRLQPYHLAEIDGGWYVIAEDCNDEGTTLEPGAGSGTGGTVGEAIDTGTLTPASMVTGSYEIRYSGAGAGGGFE
jgi:hypothetical protein